MSDILRGRVFAIACGYPDANDLSDLRKDPAFKLACGRWLYALCWSSDDHPGPLVDGSQCGRP
jgi:hypothetical protein